MAPVFRHGKGTVVLANHYNLSDVCNDTSLEVKIDKADTTCYGSNDKTYLAGQADPVVTYSGVYDANASLASFAIGEGFRKQEIIATVLGATTGLANTVGVEGSVRGRKARLFRGSPEGLKFSAPMGDAVKFEAGQFMFSRMAYGEWLVDPSSALAGASTHTSVDGGAATALGGVVHAHVTQYATTGTWTFKVQHSSNNSAFTDLTTSRSLNGAVATRWLRVETTGTVKRYLKVVVSAVTAASAPRIGIAYGRNLH